MIYFSLTSSIYAAKYENSIIILDSNHDNYISLIDDAAYYLCFIIEHSFEYNYDIYQSLDDQLLNNKQLNNWITYFLQQQIIIQTNVDNRKLIASLPAKSGGLSEYQWDTKTSWQPIKNTPIVHATQALLQLIRVQYCIKHYGIKGILQLLHKIRCQQKTEYHPHTSEITNLATSVDAASLFYPKKIFCLAWATTFVLLALKQQWKANLVIGIQTSPFYAHAWAETSGAPVINDDPQVAQVLAIILREPYRECLS